MENLILFLKNIRYFYNNAYEILQYKSCEYYGLERYNESFTNFVNISQIIVKTERDKRELLKAFEYLHDNPLIDTDYCAVNSIIHQYRQPENIVVEIQV